jgi:hypothetical protein
MDKFPNNFYRDNFVINPNTLYCNKRVNTENYRKDIFNFIKDNSINLPNSINYSFDKYVTSDISQKITSELRSRGFKVSCNYNIFKECVIMTIT